MLFNESWFPEELEHTIDLVLDEMRLLCDSSKNLQEIDLLCEYSGRTFLQMYEKLKLEGRVR